MIRGIIYKYTSPSNTSYIGQTINEEARRHKFLSENIRYAGEAIDRARRKYKPSNFKYEVLEEVYFDDGDDYVSKLNELERYYISLYDTFNNGYNCDECGNNAQMKEETKRKLSLALKGRKHTKPVSDITRKKLSEINKCHKPYFLCKNHTNDTILLMRKSRPRKKGVIGTSIKDNTTIEFDSIMDAHRQGFDESAISACCLCKRKNIKDIPGDLKNDRYFKNIYKLRFRCH